MKVDMCLSKNKQNQRGLTRNQAASLHSSPMQPSILACALGRGLSGRAGGCCAEVCSESPERQMGAFRTGREGPWSVFGGMQILPVNHHC